MVTTVQNNDVIAVVDADRIITESNDNSGKVVIYNVKTNTTIKIISSMYVNRNCFKRHRNVADMENANNAENKYILSGDYCIKDNNLYLVTCRRWFLSIIVNIYRYDISGKKQDRNEPFSNYSCDDEIEFIADTWSHPTITYNECYVYVDGKSRKLLVYKIKNCNRLFQCEHTELVKLLDKRGNKQLLLLNSTHNTNIFPIGCYMSVHIQIATIDEQNNVQIGDPISINDYCSLTDVDIIMEYVKKPEFITTLYATGYMIFKMQLYTSLPKSQYGVIFDPETNKIIAKRASNIYYDCVDLVYYEDGAYHTLDVTHRK